jgi:methylated-DNA-[protein]-cysteine S-methyltransferase
VDITVFASTLEIDESLVAASPAEIRRRVADYERGDRRSPALPVAYPDGFLGDAMRAMAAIPAGETRRYGELAVELDTAPIAVGGACARNPVPLLVPCHRVVGVDGLGGYSAADGLALKRRLLRHEGVEGSTIQGPSNPSSAASGTRRPVAEVTEPSTGKQACERRPRPPARQLPPEGFRLHLADSRRPPAPAPADRP